MGTGPDGRIRPSELGHFTDPTFSAYNSKTAANSGNLTRMSRVAKKICYLLEKFANP